MALNKKNGAGQARQDYGVTALVLQGGGALGSYQAGVYQGLAEGGIHPNWVAGISIGALNAALIAGNPPERRVEQLRAFWAFICQQSWWPSHHLTSLLGSSQQVPDAWRTWVDSMESTRALLEGQNGFFIPRPWHSLGLGSQGPTRRGSTTPVRCAPPWRASPILTALTRLAGGAWRWERVMV